MATREPEPMRDLHPRAVAHFLLLDRPESFSVTVASRTAWVEPAPFGNGRVAEMALSSNTWELLLIGALRLCDALADGRVLVTRERAAAQRFARRFDRRAIRAAEGCPSNDRGDRS